MPELMTVAALRAKHIHLFYRNQDWFADQKFMQARVPHGELSPPMSAVHVPKVPLKQRHIAEGVPLPSLAEIVGQYVQHPQALIWNRHLLTCDCDSHGQQVYVFDRGYGLEIHRIMKHDQFAAPIYR
jgi:hypothetical protein